MNIDIPDPPTLLFHTQTFMINAGCLYILAQPAKQGAFNFPTDRFPFRACGILQVSIFVKDDVGR